MNRTLLALALVAGCADNTLQHDQALPGEQVAPPATFGMQVTDASIGEDMRFVVDGLRANERVYIIRSITGPGTSTTCPAQVGGACFDLANPVELHADFRTGANGVGVGVTPVPDLPSINGRQVCFQAVAIRGASGSASVFSPRRCITAGFDDDADNTLDVDDTCPGEPDWLDWNANGAPDGCDPIGIQPPAFNTFVPSVNFVDGTFNSRDYTAYVPPSPRGLVFAFHGSGGNGPGFANSLAVSISLDTYIQQGFGFVSLSSQSRSNGAWDDNTAPAGNQDWQRVVGVRSELISQGLIGPNTRLYAMGYSGGGNMASYFGHAALAANWPVRAVVFHHATGRSDRYGDPANLPTLWVAGEFDERVAPSFMDTVFQRHVGAGRDGVFVYNREQALTPYQFAQHPNINQRVTLKNYRLLVEYGYFDIEGNRLFAAANQLQNIIDDIEALPGLAATAITGNIIDETLAGHQFNSTSAQAEATFMFNRP